MYSRSVSSRRGRRPRGLCGAFTLAAASLTGAFAHAQVGGAQPGLADWVNACALNPSTKQEARLLEATALVVPAHLLQQNRDGTFHLSNAPLGAPYCPDSRFFGEIAATAGRTGVLVGEDAILTAPHGSSFGPGGLRVIFGLSTAEGPFCQQPNFNSISADDIYTPVDVVMNAYDDAPPFTDYAVLRLDRPVAGRSPMRVRRDHALQVGDRGITAGHPLRLSQKVDRATHVRSLAAAGPVFGGLHIGAGSSGSPVYNVDAQLIEVVVARSAGQLASSFDGAGQCWRLIHNPAGGGVTNGPITAVADQIPPFELLVSPLAPVRHVAPLGGALQQPVTTHQLRSPGGRHRGHWARVSHVHLERDPRVGEVHVRTTPALELSLPEGDHYVGPGSAIPLAAAADISRVTACGAWDARYTVTDLTHGFTDTLHHRFEIGLTEVSVTPEAGAELQQLGAPYPRAATYHLANVRPTPVTIDVIPSAPWLSLNGGPAGASVQLNLPGSSGLVSNQVAVTVDIDPLAARALPVGVRQEASVTFQPAGPCDVVGPVSRTIGFTRGRQDFLVEIGEELLPPPQGGGFGPTLSVPVELLPADTYCIEELGFDLAVYPLFGLGLNHQANLLRVQLTSPGGLTQQLWNLNPLPSPDYRVVERLTLQGFEDNFDVLRLDDPTTPPVGGGRLGNFRHELVNGAWTVDIAQGAQGLALPTHVRLRVTAEECQTIGPPPPPVLR